ncbi:hypothetical protein ATANTOWER_027517 [Ataeniobius toweri]|uniref:CCHC-type domain-containing protein n=1 Tax=Ataeniobius toweri TaxID=208326 RepID=A0ABU7A8P4_9TELE|nr:hypothetical protein [Ataeniobius toweri]
MVEEPPTLDEVISVATRIDNRIRERRARAERSYFHPQLRSNSPSVVKASSQQSATEPEPILLGGTHLSFEESRRVSRQCFYCGSTDHFVATCPACPGLLKDRVHRL